MYENDRFPVRDNAFRLKGNEIGIHEQFLQVIEERRKTLYPVMKAYRGRGHRTKLVHDRLFIDGKLNAGETVARTQTSETSYTIFGGQKQTTYPVAPQGPNPMNPRPLRYTYDAFKRGELPVSEICRPDWTIAQ